MPGVEKEESFICKSKGNIGRRWQISEQQGEWFGIKELDHQNVLLASPEEYSGGVGTLRIQSLKCGNITRYWALPEKNRESTN